MSGSDNQHIYFTREEWEHAQRCQRLMHDHLHEAAAESENIQLKKEEEELFDVVVEIEVPKDAPDATLVLREELDRMYQLLNFREEEKNRWRNAAVQADLMLIRERASNRQEIIRLRKLLHVVSLEARTDTEQLHNDLSIMKKRFREVVKLLDEPRNVRPAKSEARKNLVVSQDGLSSE